MTATPPVSALGDRSEDVGCTLNMHFLDELGRPQRAIMFSSRSRQVVLADATKMRSALETYYTSIGCELLSVQVIFESEGYSENHLQPARSASHIRLVSSHSKRIYSPDARLLAASAGLDLSEDMK